MRISKKYELIFLSTPKAGSHTGWKLMEDNFSPIVVSNMHYNIVPTQYINYNAFTIVRNPYDRAVSLWNSLLWAHLTAKPNKMHIAKRYRKVFLDKVKSDKFEDFTEWLAKSRQINSDFYTKFEMSQTKYHSTSNIKCKYFQLENINNTLPKYLLEKTGVQISSIPCELKRKHESWHELKTDKARDNIIRWAEKDFESYGYDIDY